MSLAAFQVNPSYALAEDATFCWRDTNGRGVGKVPKACRPREQRIGLLCYDQCPKGMKRVGFDCHSICPDNMRNDGLFCRKTGYNRGAGKLKRNCEQAYGKDNCEKAAALWYQKCEAGYKGVATQCRPTSKPDCEKLGLKPSGIAPLSCAKRIQIGKPEVGVCGVGQERDAGLCYPNCPRGFKGVGPVCWADIPPGWFNCGAAAAKSKKDCATTIVNMFAGVGEAVLSIATMGGYGAAGKAADATGMAADASKAAKAKFFTRQLNKMKKGLAKAKSGIAKQMKEIDQLDQKIIALAKKQAKKEAKKLQRLVARKTDMMNRLKLANQKVDQINKAIEQAEIDEKSGQATDASREARGVEIAKQTLDIVAMVDPTGLVGAANAFVFPKCSQLFFTSSLQKNMTVAQSIRP